MMLGICLREGEMRQAWSLMVVAFFALFGQRPRREPEGTKSCRIQRESVRPSVRPYVRTSVRLSPPAPLRLAEAPQRLAKASQGPAQAS